MNKKGSRPRIALFGVGTLGGGHSGEGTPVLNDLFERLSNYYDITFYALTAVRSAPIPRELRVRQLISIRFPWRLKYAVLFVTALIDHLVNPYSLLFSISVHPGGPFALTLGRVLRRPVLLQLIAAEAVNLEDIGCEDLIAPWLKKLTKRVCAKADILVMVAEYQMKIARTTLAMTREIKVLPLRVVPQNFIYKKRKLSLPVQFVQVAYYSPLKDQDTLFKAFSIVAREVDCYLTVVGHGFDTPHVHSLLNQLDITSKVNCVGYIGQSELRNYYDRADILLHAARFETGCAVIQEAMASGVAVCGTRVGILADIGDDYAVIVPVRDPQKLAEGILDLVRDEGKYERITTAAYHWITQYDAAWSANNYKSFIDEIIMKQMD